MGMFGMGWLFSFLYLHYKNRMWTCTSFSIGYNSNLILLINKWISARNYDLCLLLHIVHRSAFCDVKLFYICQGKNDSMQGQLELFSRRQKFQKINTSDKMDISASLVSSNTFNDLQNSPSMCYISCCKCVFALAKN